MARGSLKARLILTNTCIVALLLVGGGYLMQRASRDASLKLLDRGLLNRAREVSENPFPGLDAPLPPQQGPGTQVRRQGQTPPGPGGSTVQAMNPASSTPGDGPNPLGPPEGGAGFDGGPGPGPEALGPGSGFRGGRGQGLGQGPGQGRGQGRGQGPRGMDFGRPVWIGANGKVVAPPRRLQPWSTELAALSLTGKQVIETISSDEGPLRVASVPVRREGKVVGAVQAVQPLEGLQVASTASREVFLWVVPIGLLASGLVAWLVLRNSLAPVERATKTAEKIAVTGLLDQRLPVTGADEMSRLSHAFNMMFEKLSASQKEKDGALSQLAQALEDQKRFTADASHELRTPLASLRLSIDSLQRSSGMEPAAVRQLGLMDGVSRGMARLVDDLLTLARADSGSLTVTREPLDLKKPLAEALLVHSLGDSDRVSVHFPEDSLMAVGDEDAVRRIAVNLLANAQRHCPEGRLIVGGKQEGSWAVFWVQDEGEGMTAEEVAHAGTRFFRADSARARDKGGHGLGLAICRSLAEAMGGGMKLTSEVGKGTAVHVWIPSPLPASAGDAPASQTS